MSLVRTPDTVSGDYTLLGAGGLRRGFTETFLNQVPDGSLRGSNYSISSRDPSSAGLVSPEAERLVRREYQRSGLAVNFGDQSADYVFGFSGWSAGIKATIKPVLRDYQKPPQYDPTFERGLEKTHLKVAATRDIAFVATGDLNAILTGERPDSRAFNEAVIIKDRGIVKDINSVLDLILSAGFSTKTNVGAELRGKLNSGNVFVTGPGVANSDGEVLQRTLGELRQGDQAVVSFPYATRDELVQSMVSAERSGADVTFIAQNPYGAKGGGSAEHTSVLIRKALASGISVRLQEKGGPLEGNMHKKQIATNRGLYIGSSNMSQTSAAHTLELGVVLDDPKLGGAAVSKALAEANAYGFIDVMSNPEKFLDLLGGIQGYRDIKAQAYLGDFASLIRPEFALVNPRRDTQSGKTIYLPTQLDESFFDTYNVPNPNIYQNYYEIVTGRRPTGLTGHVLYNVDAQLANPGIGRSFNRLTGLDAYQENKGLIGSGLALLGRGLDTLSGFHYMRQLQDAQEGSSRGSLRALHKESYKDRSYVGPFENTANFLTETISSTASSVAFYFGVSHAFGLLLSHLEERGVNNLTNSMYYGTGRGSQTGFLSVFEGDVRGVIEKAGINARVHGVSKPATTNMGNEIYNVLQTAVSNYRIEADSGFEAINKLFESAVDTDKFRALSISEQDNFLLKTLGVKEESIGGVNTRTWDTSVLSEPGFGGSMADAIGVIRKGESALVRSVVIPVLEHFMRGDENKIRTVLGKLDSLSSASVGVNLGQGGVMNIGIARKQQAAVIWDTIAEYIFGNFLAAVPGNPEGMGFAGRTDIETAGADGKLKTMRGSSIAINAFIGSGFVDIIRTTSYIGNTFKDAVLTRNFSLRQRMSGVYDDFYQSSLPESTKELNFSLDGNKPRAIGKFASARKALFLAGSALIADRVFDAYYLKPQGVDLLTQLRAEVSGSMGRDEKRFARNEFTGTMPEFLKTGALVSGGLLAGFLFSRNVSDGARELKRFNYKYAALGAAAGLFAAQAATSTAAAYLNFIYNRGKNNGLRISGEGAALSGFFGAITKRESQQGSATGAQTAAQVVLRRAAEEYTRPDVKSVRSVYNVAIQLPNPIFQLTFVSRRDPSTGITSYSGGFQLLPILGVGAIPTSPFGVISGIRGTESLQKQMMKRTLTAANVPANRESQLFFRRNYYNQLALERSQAYSENLNIVQFIPESQMLGAFATIGAMSYSRSLAAAFTGPAVEAHKLSTSFQALKDIVGFGVHQTERVIRLAQVPTLMIPELAKTFLQNFTAAKEHGVYARFSRRSRVLGPFALAMAAAMSMTSLNSSYGGASATAMLETQHELGYNPAYDAVSKIDTATNQTLYTGAIIGAYYGRALERSGAFRTAKSFADYYNDSDEATLRQLTGNQYYRSKMGQVYSEAVKAAGAGAEPKLIKTMGLRAGMVSRKLFKYSAFAFGASYLASAAGALQHGGPLSFLLDPLRLAGFDNLDPKQRALLAAGGKQAGMQADPSLGGFVATGSSFFFGKLFGLFNAGNLAGAYQDNPGMFANIAGPFGYSESKYGAKPYLQATTTFMDISNSQIDMRLGYGQSPESKKLLQNVLRISKNAGSEEAYYALIGSTPRKTPVRLRGALTSSELRAASSSSGLARALQLRQAEQMRLANQRPEELEYAALYAQVQTIATARRRGNKKAFMPGGTSSISANAVEFGARQRNLLANALEALDPNRAIDSAFYDTHERDVITQQMSEPPFIGTLLRTTGQAAGVYQSGASKAGFIDLFLATALVGSSLFAAWSVVGTTISAFALSSIDSRRTQYTKDIFNIEQSYQYKYSVSVEDPGGIRLKRNARVTEYKSMGQIKSLSKPFADMQKAASEYMAMKPKLHTYASSISSSTDADTLLSYVDDRYAALSDKGFLGDIESDELRPKLNKEKFGLTNVFSSISPNDPDDLRALQKQLAYLRYIDRIDDLTVGHYFKEPDKKFITGSFRRPRTPLPPGSSPAVANIRGGIDELGYKGLIQHGAAGLGQGIFTLSAGSDLYSLFSALTAASRRDDRDRELASYYAANMVVETGAAYATFPLLRLATRNLLASAAIVTATVVGLNIDRMAGGRVGGATKKIVEQLNRDVYKPTLRSLGRLISSVTNQGPIAGLLSIANVPFRVFDPMFTNLFIKSQQSPATTIIGQVLLPRPLEAFVLSQAGLLPSQKTILGTRYEEYTKFETEANKAQRYIQNLRRASHLGGSVSDEIAHPHISGGGYSDFYSRLGMGGRYETAGYASRIAAEFDRPSRTSGLLKLGLRQRQANVNHTISIAYRGPDNAVQDLFDIFYGAQYTKAGYFQYGSNKAFLKVNAEAVSVLITKLTGLVNIFDPTAEGSLANKIVSWIGSGFKIAGEAVGAAGTKVESLARRLPTAVQQPLGGLSRSVRGLSQRVSTAASVFGSGMASVARRYAPGLGIALLSSVLLYPMAQRAALALGASEKDASFFGGLASTGGSFASVALTPLLVHRAFANESLASKTVLAKGYRLTKQAAKVGLFATVGFVGGTLSASLAQMVLSANNRPLDEEQYQTLLNTSTGVSIAASMGYFSHAMLRNAVDWPEAVPVWKRPFKDLSAGARFIGSKTRFARTRLSRRLAVATGRTINQFKGLSKENKVTAVLFTLATLGFLATTAITRQLEGLSKTEKERYVQTTIEAIGRTALAGGIGLSLFTLSTGIGKGFLRSKIGASLVHPSGINKLWRGAAVAKRSVSTIPSQIKTFVANRAFRGFVKSVAVGSAVLTPLIFERGLLDLNETSTRIKSEAAYKNFFAATAATALMILSRGRIPNQIQSMLSLDSFLNNNRVLDQASTYAYENINPADNAVVYGGAIAGLGLTYAGARLAAKQASAVTAKPSLLLKGAGRVVGTAVVAADIFYSSAKKGRDLDPIETRSSVVNRITNQLSEDMAGASISAGLAGVRGLNPLGLIVAAAGVAGYVGFKSDPFKAYLKQEYASKLANAGVDSRDEVQQVLQHARRKSDQGAIAGFVSSTAVIGALAIAGKVLGVTALAAGAVGATVTAPAWVPAAAIGFAAATAVVGAATYLGSALGYKHGLDSELNRRTQGRAARMPKQLGSVVAQTTEHEVIATAQARKVGLLTTFVVDKDQVEHLPEGRDSYDVKKNVPKSWWERLFDWAGSTARGLWNATTGRAINNIGRFVRKAVEVGGDLMEGLSDAMFGAPGLTANQRAWLHVARVAEGTHKPGLDSYRVMFGGGLFNDLSKHPDKVVRTSGYASAAAGAYQFMPGTWARAAKALGLKDFSPASQDRAALWLYEMRGVNTRTAPFTRENVAKAAGEWASFPNLAGVSAYGQPVKRYEDLKREFEGELKRDYDPNRFGMPNFGGGGEGILFVRNINQGGPAIHIDLRPNARGGGAIQKGQETAAETALVKRAAFLYIKEAFRQGETELGIHAPQTRSSTLTNKSTDVQIMAAINAAGLRGHHNNSAAIDVNLFNITRFVAPSLGRIVARDKEGVGRGWSGTHVTSSGVTVHHGLKGVQAPSYPVLNSISEVPSVPSSASTARITPHPVRKASQKDWQSQTNTRPGHIVIAAGHADVAATGLPGDSIGAPGERKFNMLLLNRLEQRLVETGLGNRVSFYRPGGTVLANDPRSQYSIAMRVAQQGGYYLELHGDRGDSQGRSGLIGPSPKDTRFNKTSSHKYNPLDEDLAAAYGSFSKNHRVLKDNKALGVVARGGRILEITTITSRINDIIDSGDQKKIRALLDSYIDRLLPILLKNFGQGRTSPAARRRAQAPASDLAPKTAQSMINSTTEVVAAIPVAEQAALIAGTMAIVEQAEQQTAKLERELISTPIVVNPDRYNKTNDTVNANSDALALRIPDRRVPTVVSAERVGSKRVVEIETSIPVAAYQERLSNGNIPFGEQLQTAHEPMLLGDYDGNPVTPYGVMQTMHGLA